MSEHDQPIAPNLLARQFEATHPNQRWVTDTTELVAGNGRLFLAAVLDLYSRLIVGWALSAVNDRHLTLNALDQALRRRHPEAGLLHHSDQGSTYASEGQLLRQRRHGELVLDPEVRARRVTIQRTAELAGRGWHRCTIRWVLGDGWGRERHLRAGGDCA